MKILEAETILIFAAFFGSLSLQENCPKKDHALIIALLALHRGEDCKLVLQKGVQQIAALEITLNKINSQNDLKLDLKVFDTCSTKEEATKSALKAMVFADQACSEPRLFLGFLGPDDPESLAAVIKVTDIFNYTHVVPRAIRSFEQHNALNVEAIKPENEAQIISSLLKELNWISIVLIHTSDSSMTETATSLIESNTFCVLQPVLKIPSSTMGVSDVSSYEKSMHRLKGVDDIKIVLLADTAESVEFFLKFVSDAINDNTILIYVQGSGILPWKLSKGIAKNCIILQQTTKSSMIPQNLQSYLKQTSLYSSYLNQNIQHICKDDTNLCESFEMSIDSTLLPLTYSLHLYSKALRNAHYKKCPNSSGICTAMFKISKEQWKEILENSVVTLKDEIVDQNRKIQFHMDSDSVTDVIVYNDLGFFETVGSISNVKKISFHKRNRLLLPIVAGSSQCSSRRNIVSIPESTGSPDILEKATEDSVKASDETYSIFGFILSYDEFGYYEIVATIVGFSIGILTFIMLITYIIYRTLKVKSNTSRCSDKSGGSDKSDP